jgi:hypothetical protein
VLARDGGEALRPRLELHPGIPGRPGRASPAASPVDPDARGLRLRAVGQSKTDGERVDGLREDLDPVPGLRPPGLDLQPVALLVAADVPRGLGEPLEPEGAAGVGPGLSPASPVPEVGLQGVADDLLEVALVEDSGTAAPTVGSMRILARGVDQDTGDRATFRVLHGAGEAPVAALDLRLRKRGDEALQRLARGGGDGRRLDDLHPATAWPFGLLDLRSHGERTGTPRGAENEAECASHGEDDDEQDPDGPGHRFSPAPGTPRIPDNVVCANRRSGRGRPSRSPTACPGPSLS